jgi:aldehyde dehydrogenase (NAD+)
MNIAVKQVNVAAEAAAILDNLGVDKALYVGGNMASYSPVTGEQIGALKTVSAAEATSVIAKADEAFRAWRLVPAPRRGELVRLLGEELRAAKAELGRLVSIEAGKITSEGLGEVQEMIDICDFAVGLSRQLYGLTIATERPGHRMMETWHPLGVVGVISAFNFPVAVWSWNAALALVCGNSVVWKPSEKTPLTALASQAILNRAIARFGDAPEGLSQVLIGDRSIGEVLVDDRKVALVSATGSTRMGREVGPRLARRFARSILELGGNNAGIVCPSADLDMALRAIAFGAMGTAGQRFSCMTASTTNSYRDSRRPMRA